MFSLPKKISEKENQYTNTANDMLECCIVRQMYQLNTAIIASEDEKRFNFTTKNKWDAEANDVLCQNYKKVSKKDELLTVNEDSYCAEKCSLIAGYK